MDDGDVPLRVGQDEVGKGASNVDADQLHADDSSVAEAETMKAGRDPRTIARAYVSQGRCQPDEQKGADGTRRPYTGRPADVAADIAGFAAAGVEHFFLSVPAPSLSEARADLAWFAEEVRPLIN